MSEKLAQFIQAGLALPLDERLLVVHELLASVDAGPDGDADPYRGEWSAELDRRVGDVISGRVDTLDGVDVLSAARDALTGRQG